MALRAAAGARGGRARGLLWERATPVRPFQPKGTAV